MTFWRGALAVLTAGLLSSCAIHPLPQDFSGVSTDTIVRQVRCETRNAATNLVLGELQLVMMPGNLKQLPAREADKIEALFNTIRADRDGIDVFNPERDLPGDNLKRVRAYLDVIYSTGVAYNFDLTMSETNNLSAGFDLLGPFAPKFTMGFKADLNRSRGNERTFTLTDKLGDLMARPMKFANGASYCADKLVAKNFIYPITGEVGVSDTINDFFALVISDNVEGSASPPPASGAPKQQPWADQLAFTTMLDASVTPAITFSPVKNGLQVADASFSPSVSRTDTHKLGFGIATDACKLATFLELQVDALKYSSPSDKAASKKATTAACTKAKTPAATPAAKDPRTVTAPGTQSDVEKLAQAAIEALKQREIIVVTPY